MPNPGPKLGVCIPVNDAGTDGFESRVIVDGVLGPFSIVVEVEVAVGDGGNTNKVCEGVIRPVVIPAPSPGVDSEERRRLPLLMLDIEVEEEEEEDNDEDNRTLCRSDEEGREILDSERLRMGVGMGLGVGASWEFAGIDFVVGIDAVDIEIEGAGDIVVDCKLSLIPVIAPPSASLFSITRATGDAGTGGRAYRLKLKLGGLRFAFGFVREGAGEGDGDRRGGRSNVERMAVTGAG